MENILMRSDDIIKKDWRGIGKDLEHELLLGILLDIRRIAIADYNIHADKEGLSCIEILV